MTQNKSDKIKPTSYIKSLPVRDRISISQPLGLDTINLGYNELPFKPTKKIALAIEKIKQSAGSYGDPMCFDLRSKIEDVYDIKKEKVICGNGSEELIDVIARNFVSSDDEILISEFGYIQFVLAANRLNAKLVKASEKLFCTDVDQILGKVSSKTKLIFMANPNNPTGTFIELGEIRRLIENIPTNVALVLDLAYGEFVSFDYCRQIHNLVDQYENVIVTRTFSKAFGLAGLRVGWCHAPTEMISGFYAARGMGSVNAMAQAAAKASLDDIEEIQSRVNLIIDERERVARALLEIGVHTLPSRANFLLASTNNQDVQTIEGLVQFLFNEAGIIVNRTRETGLEGFMRFSLSFPENNDLLIKTCSRYLAEGLS